ncbi:uncharacterized protein LOC128248715 isoform X2 [Octopus bimaculoides]|uniref:uncharacterized protein LOC128248715 isoform X2 n=1 Tax=Octopus bimaculoides TaxID=37653 RepID=UPI0022E69BB2|nr:uncharacterized protein LOC128248715 isoform X2 [Octopus bimaculoides]
MEQLLKTVVKQQEQQQQQLQKLTDLILQSGNTTESFSADGVTNSIEKFQYKLDEGTTFTAYYKRYEDIFREECKGWSSERKSIVLTGFTNWRTRS